MKLIDILPIISGFYSIWLNGESVENDTEYLNNEVIDIVATTCSDTTGFISTGHYPEIQIYIK